MPTRLKVCCIASREEATLAIRNGASAIGLVSAMPSGPGPIDEALIAEISADVPPPIATFLLTSATRADAIVAQVRRCRTSAVQLVDAVELTVYGELRLALPGVKLVQVIHVQNEESIGEAREAARHVDALLLDSGRPKLAVKELGGTGRVHDWRLSRRIVESVSIPVFLAGGLNPGNVRDAIAAVRPFGIDVCSGLRSDGRLDEAKLAPFAAAVLGA
ncbi:MAG: phosphoribosylanthranilate isomerase [Alphaproteobacteria bacterium]|nr:phosphoribosylanthranilate isomerase [Alphaproteobacteria bacterium]